MMMKRFKSVFVCWLVAFGIPVAAEDAPSITASEVVKVADGFRFTEGPVWMPDGYLLFSDIPANKIMKWQDENVTVFREDSGQSNGLTLDKDGRLIACEHGNRRVSRTEADGTITVIAETYKGKKFNSPNDCVVRSDGTIFFTDPDYGLGNRPAEIGFNGVYRVNPGEEPVLLADDFNKPNGILLSPDETKLYVADTANNHVRVFEVAGDGSVSGGSVLCSMQHPDGMAIDVNGNLYVTASTGVEVFNHEGKKIGTIQVPLPPANCGFGGGEYKTLFITARTGLFKVETTHAGLPIGKKE